MAQYLKFTTEKPLKQRSPWTFFVTFVIIIMLFSFLGYRYYSQMDHAGTNEQNISQAHAHISQLSEAYQAYYSNVFTHPFSADTLLLNKVLSRTDSNQLLLKNQLLHSEAFADTSLSNRLDSVVRNYTIIQQQIRTQLNISHHLSATYQSSILPFSELLTGFAMTLPEELTNETAIYSALLQISKDIHTAKRIESLTQTERSIQDVIYDLSGYSVDMTDADLYLRDINVLYADYQKTIENLKENQASFQSRHHPLVELLTHSENYLSTLSDDFTQQYETGKKTIMILFILLVLLILLEALTWTLYYKNRILKPAYHLRENLHQMHEGGIPDFKQFAKAAAFINDFINDLQIHVQNLRNVIGFANELKNGNLKAEYTATGTHDALGKSLIEMRDSLARAEEESHNRMKSEQIQNWLSKGTALISEVLNHNYNNTNDLGFSIIKNIVNYLKINQGGIFFVNDEDEENQFLELKAAFAYNRRKFVEGRIEFGEGYVGAAVLEKQTVYRKELPSDYISVTSGLGDAPPRVLLIVPLLIEDNIYGAIELASFNELEEHQIEFVKSVSENIATTLSGVKSKERTEKLLKETQDQSNKIAQTEEEMRQNLEEMQATQEESARRENLLKQELDIANEKIARLEKELKEQKGN